MAAINQIGLLSINDTEITGALITNSIINFNRGSKSVTATITATGFYTDKSPIFDFFIQNQSANVKLTYFNLVDSGGETSRTITFEKAICKDYLEDYDREKAIDDFVDILIVFTLEADSVAMGETNFPG